jgi:hypothetical protein
VPAPLPHNESARRKALDDQRILDTPPERAFDDLVRFASFMCGTPTSMISLAYEKRQWFKARVGSERRETLRDTILSPDEVTVVGNAAADERFAGNPLVTANPDIRFYAGAPLVTTEGFALGSLCVIDRIPRNPPPPAN